MDPHQIHHGPLEAHRNSIDLQKAHQRHSESHRDHVEVHHDPLERVDAHKDNVANTFGKIELAKSLEELKDQLQNDTEDPHEYRENSEATENDEEDNPRKLSFKRSRFTIEPVNNDIIKVLDRKIDMKPKKIRYLSGGNKVQPQSPQARVRRNAFSSGSIVASIPEDLEGEEFDLESYTH